MTAITLLQIPIKYRPLNVGHERMLHRPARFERRQNRVCVHRSALKNLVSQCIRQSVQDRSAPTSNRRLAATARAGPGFPPVFFAAISGGFCLAAIAVAYAARVMACVV